MKFIIKLSLLSIFFFSFKGHAQDPFIFEVEIPPFWNEFRIPIDSNHNYNYTVEWEMDKPAQMFHQI